jgi:hypothetical protein
MLQIGTTSERQRHEICFGGGVYPRGMHAGQPWSTTMSSVNHTSNVKTEKKEKERVQKNRRRIE